VYIKRNDNGSRGGHIPAKMNEPQHMHTVKSRERGDIALPKGHPYTHIFRPCTLQPAHVQIRGHLCTSLKDTSPFHTHSGRWDGGSGGSGGDHRRPPPGSNNNGPCMPAALSPAIPKPSMHLIAGGRRNPRGQPPSQPPCKGHATAHRQRHGSVHLRLSSAVPPCTLPAGC
jgi:hypothetical protein